MAINIDINSRSLVEMQNRLRQINSELENISDADAINNLTREAEQLNTELNQTTQSTKNLKTQLREITIELQGLEPGTARFNELSIAAGQLRDTIQDTNAVINATAGSAIENLGTGLTGVAGVGISAFQGLASAQALFGNESKALQETLVKLQALAGLSDAVKSLGGLKDTITTVKASFIALTTQLGLFKTAETAATTATVAQTTATEGATVAQAGLNATMLANPIFLVIAAIAALTTAMYLYSESTKTSEEDLKKLNATLDENSAAYERSFKKINQAQENRINLLKSQGASEKEILDEEIIAIKQQEAQRKVELENTNEAIIEFKKIYNQAVKEGNEEAAKEAATTLKRLRKERGELLDLNGQFLVDIKIKQNEFDKKQDEDADAKAEKRKAAAKKYYDDLRKIQLQAQQNAYKEEQDYLNEIDKLIEDNYNKTLSDQEREIKIVQDKYFELESKAQGNAEQLAIIEESKLNAINDIKLKYAAIEQAAKDKNDADEEAAKQKTIDRLVEEEKAREAANKKEIEDAKKVQAAKVQVVSDGISAIQSLTELFAKGNEKQQKTAFNINKAAGIAKATVDTYVAANSALATLPPPFGAIAAGISIAAGLANVAKIASTKFESPNASTDTNTTTSQSGSVTNATPSFTLSGQGNKTQTGATETKETNQSINVSVSVEEITNTQNRLTKLKEIGSL